MNELQTTSPDCVQSPYAHELTADSFTRLCTDNHRMLMNQPQTASSDRILTITVCSWINRRQLHPSVYWQSPYAYEPTTDSFTRLCTDNQRLLMN